MPDLIGTGRQVQAVLTGFVEQAEFDPFGVGGEEGKIDPARFDACAERPRPPGLKARA